MSATTNLSVTCSASPTPIAFTVESEIDFGSLQVNSSQVVTRPLSVRITSGTQLPSATLIFTSDRTTVDGIINLGGGTVSLKRNSDSKEIKMIEAFQVDSRDMGFTASLNPAGATPGMASSNMNI
ncbi:TPA: hypothetical protein ACY3HI_001982 [Citrobacter braakii]